MGLYLFVQVLCCQEDSSQDYLTDFDDHYEDIEDMEDDKHGHAALVFDVDPGIPWFQDSVGGNMMGEPRQNILISRIGEEDTEPGGRMKRDDGGRLLRMSMRQNRQKYTSVKRNLLRMAKRFSSVPKKAKRTGLVRMSKRAGLVRMSKRPSYTYITSMPNLYRVPRSRPFLDRITKRAGLVRMSKKSWHPPWNHRAEQVLQGQDGQFFQMVKFSNMKRDPILRMM